jgi:hypothetical protein
MVHRLALAASLLGESLKVYVVVFALVRLMDVVEGKIKEVVPDAIHSFVFTSLLVAPWQ